MEFLQHPRLRSFARRSGLKQFVYKIYFSLTKPSRYEARFSDAVLAAIRPGDCVWDVGANVGVYTLKFAQHVGESGKVIAFEPFADTFQQLSVNTNSLIQVQCVRLALGADDEQIKVQPISPANSSNSVWQKDDSSAGELICIKPGAKLIRDGYKPPNILKIDVEGFEEEVLWGLRESLRDKGCRAVFLEVHYNTLDQRGLLHAPSRLVSTRQDLGFKTRWVDRAHLQGTRDAALPPK
jgi:FkbM family methyltransferase